MQYQMLINELVVDNDLLQVEIVGNNNDNIADECECSGSTSRWWDESVLWRMATSRLFRLLPRLLKGLMTLPGCVAFATTIITTLLNCVVLLGQGASVRVSFAG
jgi:hypothetical protein